MQEQTVGIDELPVVLPRRKPPVEADMDITPMIDITFLLLIFFLVASHLDSARRHDLPKARYGVAVPTDSAVIITVAKTPDGQVAYYQGDAKAPQRRFKQTSEPELQAAIEQYVRREFSTHADKQAVILLAERGLTSGQVAVAHRGASAATDKKIHDAVWDAD